MHSLRWQIALQGAVPGLSYFPAYELLIDELRDYRFYEEDLAHPRPEAIRQVMGRFDAAYLGPEALALSKALRPILRGLAHRPRDPDGEAHQHHLERLRLRLEALGETFPEAHLAPLHLAISARQLNH